MKNKNPFKIKTRLSIMYILVFALFLIVFSNCTKSKKPTPDKAETVSDNPLLTAFNTPFNLPPFDKVKPKHFLPALKEGIKRQKEEIEAIIKNPEAPTFANTIAAMDSSGSLLKEVDMIFSAITRANTNSQIQMIEKEFRPLLKGHEDDISMNKALFNRVKTVYEKKDQLAMTGEELKVLETFYKEFTRGGANLNPEKQARLKDINKEIEILKVKFAENLLAETNRFKLIIDKKEDLEGLPKDVIDSAAETAIQMGEKGKWVFTIHKPSLIPFLQYSTKRELRERMFKAYTSQGDHNDEYDNKETILKIVSLRDEKAKLLGFKNHASYKLDVNMAKDPQTVYSFLEKLWKPALATAKKEAQELQTLINKESKKFKLQPWDWWYYAEKLKKAKFDLDENLTKPYFQLENVRDGVFYVANKLFGLKFIRNKDIPTYHPDVQVFEVQEANGTHLGILYMDFYARSSKRGGAWMNNLREQTIKEGKRIPPVVTNNCNFAKPTGETPTLLSFDQVGSVFHEFGHAIHSLLSNCTYEEISGTNVALDFVELPSQIMENWIMEPEVLKVYAKHYKTGEMIPNELLEKIKKSKTFNQGFANTERIAAALLDMDWYTAENPGQLDVKQFETQSLSKMGLIPEIVVRYRSTYFNHIFNSMYSAGYYSYIWAEVLEADAFQAFKDTNIFDPKTALAFRKNILEMGGGADPMELYKRFRGAEPKIEALLKRNGLSE